MKVLVTGVTRNAGMAVLRGLAQAGCTVVGSDDRKLPWGIHSRYTGPYYWHAVQHNEEFIPSLIDILKKEHPDVLVPITGTEQISQCRKEIEQYTALLVPHYDSFMAAHDNKTTMQECSALGIQCPRLFNETEARRYLAQKNNKKSSVLVVKPRKDVGASRGLAIVSDEEALVQAKQAAEERFGETIIEEYIPGEESMKTVNVLFDKKAKLRAYFTTTKLRQWPPRNGQTAMSMSTNERKLVDMVLPFFEKWKWEGPAEVELKVDERDGKPKVIEINPRIWSYIGFPIRCGLNLPMITCNFAEGRDSGIRECPPYDIGVKYIHFSYYARAVMKDIISGKNKIKEISRVIKELKGKKVSNNIEIRDSMVVLAKTIYELRPKK